MIAPDIVSQDQLSIIDAMDDPHLFAPWFKGASWDGWRSILKAAFALPMTGAEVEFFRTIAERDPPTKRARELWICAGRRAGKDSIASLILAHAAALFDASDKLRPGERALCACLATDRDQARIVMNYTKSFFADIPLLKDMVRRETANGFELDNGVDISVSTNSFRTVRGRPVLSAVFDECAFWRDESSASPDEEVYRAVVPSMATMPTSMLIAISSPYRRSGLLFKKYRDHFGRDGDVLVVKAPSRTLNPTLDQSIIDRAMADDPAAASAEWMAEFRTDIESFVSREAIDAALVPDRFELPFVPGVRYVAFCDPSGGSGQDSMTLGVAHKEGEVSVLDCVREVRPPFSPDSCVVDFAALLASYKIRSVTGDRWGGEFVREAFKKKGITYDISERVKSDLYRELLPLLNSGRIELLDHKRLVTQLCSLERRTARGGKDSIDHPVAAHDDIANAAAGALVLASNRARQPMVISPELLRRASVPMHLRRYL
jgi:hypothetical protein